MEQHKRAINLMPASAAAPYNSLSRYLQQRFGQRVQKIPLDAGFTCPNRDGVISRRGCSFCNPDGSGTGLLEKGMDMPAQWEHWMKLLDKRRQRAELFLAYLQSYSNTYGPLSRIRQVLGELEGLPGLVGLSMGTRPDCLDRDKLDLIAAFPAREIHLELGLQSANDETLKRINRGHDAACFAQTTKRAAKRGIKVVAHLMAGLPGEDEEAFLATVDFVNSLPVHGVKLHNLYVCRGTTLAAQLRQGSYTPLTLSDYISMVARALSRLRPDIIIHRLNGDPVKDELLEPEWAGEKQLILAEVDTLLASRKVFQGSDYTASKST